MAQFAVEIADADVSRVLDAVAVNYNRPEQVENPDFDDSQPESETNTRFIDNPESKAVFANKIVRSFLTENVKAYEIKLAKQAASEAAEAVAGVTITDPQV
jgi:hypothetical protein|tara:strand:+ start:494 stop:796 length:303 start_codon:yes stop_codon:yes gene_type:complete